MHSIGSHSLNWFKSKERVSEGLRRLAVRVANLREVALPLRGPVQLSGLSPKPIGLRVTRLKAKRVDISPNCSLRSLSRRAPSPNQRFIRGIPMFCYVKRVVALLLTAKIKKA
jgi:hypothetical protein